MDRIDVKNAQFNRECISKRLAVKHLKTIAETVLPYGVSSLHTAHSGKWDYGLTIMIDKIRHMKKEAEKYRQLKAILKSTID